MKLNLNKKYVVKKIVYIYCLVFISFCLTACENKNVNIEESINKITLESDLITYEALYHNVIEYEKKKGTGFTHLLEKDREMFVEYTGTIELGIDLSNVKINVVDNKINVIVPKAIVVGEPSVDDSQFNENNFIENNDGLINKNPITLDDSVEAFQLAQSNMKESVSKDKELLKQAHVRAQLILEEMIRNVIPLEENKYIINFEEEK